MHGHRCVKAMVANAKLAVFGCRAGSFWPILPDHLAAVAQAPLVFNALIDRR